MFLNIHFPFEKQIVSFLLWLDSVGYKTFSIFYKTFLKLAQQEIFKEDAFDTVYNNLYLIIGVVALFLMAYLLLKMMINPDEKNSSKEIRDMGFRFVIAMIMIVLLPTFFDFLIDFQNSILEYNVIPKALLDTQIAIQEVDENGNNVGELQFIDSNDINLTTEIMQYRANELVASLISGLMYPLKTDQASYDGEPATKQFDSEIGTYRYIDANGEEWSTDVSEGWDGSAQALALGIGCTAGAAGLVIFTVATGGVGALLGIGLGSAAFACVAGGLTAHGVGSVIAAIDAEQYTWTNALQAITLMSNYSQISLFAGAIVDGTFHYTPILSTIVVGILVYIMISFCFDVVVRQAKLMFYQLLAPLCFLISVNPKSKDLMGKWFKLVLTCYLEVFIRVAMVCLIVLLIGKIDLDRLSSITHPIISSFVILGIVIFAKQIPKLFSELTGINSNNMKLNLREKFADGGGFVASSIIGSGTKMLGRGLNNTYKAAKDNYEYDASLRGGKGGYKLKSGKNWRNVAGSVIGGLGKTVTGTISAQVNGGINARNAKNYKDMHSSVNNAVSKVEESQNKKHKYIASHGGTIKGVTGGLLGDAKQGFKNYVGAKDEIIAQVKAEDAYISAFDDYEAIYADSAYKALDAQKDQLEARIAAEGASTETYAGSGVTLQDAYNQAKNQLLKKRLESIQKNKNGAAYTVYSLAKMVAEDPDMAERIGASQDLMAVKNDFKLVTDKVTGETIVCHSNGTEWDTDSIMKLLEGTDLTAVSTHLATTPTLEYVVPTGGTEMYQSKKDVKARRNTDKNSVAYKEAMKKEQLTKNNN